MQLGILDGVVIAAYFALSLWIGLRYSKRAGTSSSEFFLSGRTLPWWLAGTSMVATTFAADTPLAVTELVTKYGVAGNWFWWSFALSGMLTVFAFAKLWRRSEVMTDQEFAELRYSGRPAAFLRGFRAVYLGLFANCLIIGWVNLAMAKILELTLGWNMFQSLAACVVVTGAYSLLSGLWGVVLTDAIQFVIAMVGAVVLALYSLSAVGGVDALVQKLGQATPAGSLVPFGSADAVLSLLPHGQPWAVPLMTFLVYLGAQWWASWYPGAEPGGGGYIVQRLLATRSERDSVLATLWFNIAHYALRPWPWIIVGLCALVLYPGGGVYAKDPGKLYVQVLIDHLPPAWRGVMLASFAAAYMSTLSTQLNWGASYLVGDVYLRFMKRDATPRQQANAGRIATAIVLLASCLVTPQMESIKTAWEWLLAVGAGTGAVYALRWYWWRVSAWSEISAMVVALIMAIVVNRIPGLAGDRLDDVSVRFLVIAGVTTIAWVGLTFIMPATDRGVLDRFYAKIRPEGPGWRPFSGAHAGQFRFVFVSFARTLLSVVAVYSVLGATGEIIFGAPLKAAGLIALAVVAGALSVRQLDTGTRYQGT